MIKLGIVGTNFVSDWMAEAVKNSEDIETSAVYSRSEDTGHIFAQKHGIHEVYTSYDDFLKSDIDAVYIASPNSLHYYQASEAIKMNRHVLIEKPAALSAEEFKSLTELSERFGVVMLEAMRPAHDPSVISIRDKIGNIGKIRRAVFEFCQYSSRYDKFKSGEILNAFNPSLGNAAVMDIGVYALHACVMTFGEPLSVCSESFIFPNGMEGCGKAGLKYDGFTADVIYSKIYDSVTPSFITGENGSLIIGKISTGENVRLKLRGKDEISLADDRPVKPELNMIYEVSDFVKSIKGEIDPEHFNTDTMITLRIIDKIREQNSIKFN